MQEGDAGSDGGKGAAKGADKVGGTMEAPGTVGLSTDFHADGEPVEWRDQIGDEPLAGKIVGVESDVERVYLRHTPTWSPTTARIQRTTQWGPIGNGDVTDRIVVRVLRDVAVLDPVQESEQPVLGKAELGDEPVVLQHLMHARLPRARR